MSIPTLLGSVQDSSMVVIGKDGKVIRPPNVAATVAMEDGHCETPGSGSEPESRDCLELVGLLQTQGLGYTKTTSELREELNLLCAVTAKLCQCCDHLRNENKTLSQKLQKGRDVVNQVSNIAREKKRRIKELEEELYQLRQRQMEKSLSVESSSASTASDEDFPLQLPQVKELEKKVKRLERELQHKDQALEKACADQEAALKAMQDKYRSKVIAMKAEMEDARTGLESEKDRRAQLEEQTGKLTEQWDALKTERDSLFEAVTNTVKEKEDLEVKFKECRDKQNRLESRCGMYKDMVQQERDGHASKKKELAKLTTKYEELQAKHDRFKRLHHECYDIRESNQELKEENQRLKDRLQRQGGRTPSPAARSDLRLVSSPTTTGPPDAARVVKRTIQVPSLPRARKIPSQERE